MKRLVEPVFGGIPYINDDFTNILQNEHLKSYRAIIEALNIDSYTQSDYNRGIILKGCEIKLALPNPGATFQINFGNSLIYLDGEFYTYNATQSVITPTIASDTVYLYANTTQSSVRYLLDGTSPDIVDLAYFTYSTTEPVGKAYVKFSNLGTSRYFERIFKYTTSRKGDIYVRNSLQGFSATGLGFNNMEGFVVLQSNQNKGPNLEGRFLKGYVYGQFPNYNLNTQAGSNTNQLTINQIEPHIHETEATTYSMNHTHPLNTTFNNADYLYDSTSQYDGLNATDYVINLPGYDYTLEYRTGNLSFKNDPNLFNPLTYDINNEPNSIAQPNPDMRHGSMRTGAFGFPLGYDESFVRVFTTGMIDPLTYLKKSPGAFNETYISNENNFTNRFLTHSHTFTHDVSNVGNGAVGTPGAVHENRPPYYTVVYYTKI